MKLSELEIGQKAKVLKLDIEDRQIKRHLLLLFLQRLKGALSEFPIL